MLILFLIGNSLFGNDLNPIGFSWNLQPLSLSFLGEFVFNVWQVEINIWFLPIKTSLVTLQNIGNQLLISSKYALRKNCPYSELLWSVFSRIRTAYSVRMRENADQNNSEYGHSSAVMAIQQLHQRHQLKCNYILKIQGTGAPVVEAAVR